MTQRVIVYIDGFNLYFGLRSKNWRKYYWLDLVKLSHALLKPNQTLESVRYFTTRIRDNGRNDQDIRRQATYLEALETLDGLTIEYGHYLVKRKKCKQCGTKWTDYEEKMTDVNIAVRLMADAFDDRFDTALLISGDSDLTTPVEQVRSRFHQKRVIVVSPPGRHSSSLNKVAHGGYVLGEANLRQSQLPSTVARADGYLLQRPDHWN
jgi:uncharacterized LabA/DUF88 family protein